MGKDRDTTARPSANSSRAWLEAILVALLFLRFANTFVVQTFYIPSGSMKDTLLIGDHLFVNRFIFGPEGAGEGAVLPQRPVQRGDIVVFRSVEDANQDVVKRCVAVAGDRVEIRGTGLWINDSRVDDSSYAVYRLSPAQRAMQEIRNRDHYGPITVPPKSVFCLGDNRDESYDSRFWGPLPLSHIKGRASVIYWSYSGEVSDGSWPGLVAKVRQVATMIFTAPFRTRWDRLFRVVR